MAGNSFDETVNFNYTMKKNEGSDQPLSTLQDFIEAQIQERKDECEWESGSSKDKQRDGLLRACSSAIRVASTEIFPKVEPVAVQKEVSFEIRPGLRFVGYIDLIDYPRIIVDNKTTWKKWSTAKLWQHSAYEYALRKSEGTIGTEPARYDVMQLKRRGDSEAFSFSAPVSELQLSLVENKINWAVNFLEHAGIDKSKYNYNTSTWMCGPSCAHVDRCEMELGIRLR